MPEIPEIETMRRGLASRLAGKTVKTIEILRRKAVNVPPEKFIEALAGAAVTTIERRAKILIFSFSSQYSFLVHFMLEGFPRVFYSNETPDGQPSLSITFTTGEQLAFFRINLGYIQLVETESLPQVDKLAGLGPEPLVDSFTYDAFAALIRSKKGMIKPLLMDQTFIAGIGNVYSNEILFCCRLLPTRKASSLSDAERAALYKCIRRILSQALHHGGVYEEQLASDDIASGGYTALLQVAYRTGQPCYVCGHPIETKRVGGRNAFYCPVCQK